MAHLWRLGELGEGQSPSLGPQVSTSASNPDILCNELAILVGDRAHEVPGDGLVKERADPLIGGENVGILRHFVLRGREMEDKVDRGTSSTCSIDAWFEQIAWMFIYSRVKTGKRCRELSSINTVKCSCDFIVPANAPQSTGEGIHRSSRRS